MTVNKVRGLKTRQNQLIADSVCLKIIASGSQTYSIWVEPEITTIKYSFVHKSFIFDHKILQVRGPGLFFTPTLAPVTA